MSKAAMNLQDSFLNQVRRENSEVRVLLVNGTLLRGTVKGFDNFTLILNNRNGQHLIYKHAVAQIVTHRSHLKTEDIATDDSPAEGNNSENPDDAPKSETTPKSEDSPKTEKSEKPAGTQHRPEKTHSDRQSPRKQPRGDSSHGNQNPKSKKEGFNTLDLSSVKLGSEKSKS